MIKVSNNNFYVRYFFGLISIFSFAQNKFDTLSVYDLSNKNLTEIPNLSKSRIKKLNLANNKIETIDFLL